MKRYRIAAVNGDGIGDEIVPAGIEVLQALAEKFHFLVDIQDFPWGAGYYLQHGAFMSDDGLEDLKAFDAILFGAVGLPEVDDRLPFRDYTNKVRTAFKQYVNLRPVRSFPGIKGPLRQASAGDIDFVIIRENNEGEFVQSGRHLYPEQPEGMAIDTSIFTRAGIERVAHYAFKLAQQRKGNLTNVTKSNTLIYTLGYWDKVIGEVSEHYPDVSYKKMYVDAASANFVLHPEYFDVILTTNMIGDILSDLGGAIMGSLGLGGSGNINPEGDYPSMFEPIHGSAPDIAGQGIANPIGLFWSVSLMLDHLGEIAAAKHLLNTIDQVTSESEMTRDLGGEAKTADLTKLMLDKIHASTPATI
ncbi:MAG: tartrate dehydrogenase [Saprospiraceae bacterium]|nr:tartrate dehydrogenase [Saprospiraceae bacterium]